MRHIAVVTLTLLALLALTSSVQAQYGGQGQSQAEEPAAYDPVFRRLEVIMEGGLAIPLGDLSANPDHTLEGMGAELGYTLGVRLRFFLNQSLTVAPCFSYTEFGDHDGTIGDQIYRINTRVLRYGLDLVYITPGGHKTLRPFVGIGGAFVRNKYREENETLETFYEAGVNGLTWSLMAGVRLANWDLTLQYDANKFQTTQFIYPPEDLDYDWTNLSLRVGYILPRF